METWQQNGILHRITTKGGILATFGRDISVASYQKSGVMALLSTPCFSWTTLLVSECCTTSSKSGSSWSRHDLQHGREVITLSYGRRDLIGSGTKSQVCRKAGKIEFFLFWIKFMIPMNTRSKRIGPRTPHRTAGPPARRK